MGKLGQLAWQALKAVAKAWSLKKSVDVIDKVGKDVVESVKKHGFQIPPSPAPFAPHYDPTGGVPFKQISMVDRLPKHPINLMNSAKHIGKGPIIRL